MICKNIIKTIFPYSSVSCTGLKFFNKSSAFPCPATCRFTKQKDIKCDNSSSNLLQVYTPGTPIVTVRSTDSECSATQHRYPRRQMCLYNIDMSSCPSGLVRVNDASHLNITTRSDRGCTGDFLLVMLSNGQNYKVCGTSWPSYLHIIRDTKFQLLFWSGQNYETRGTGFKLQLECHTRPVEPSSTAAHDESTSVVHEGSTPVQHTSLTTAIPSPTPLDIIETSSSGDYN